MTIVDICQYHSGNFIGKQSRQPKHGTPTTTPTKTTAAFSNLYTFCTIYYNYYDKDDLSFFSPKSYHDHFFSGELQDSPRKNRFSRNQLQIICKSTHKTCTQSRTQKHYTTRPDETHAVSHFYNQIIFIIISKLQSVAKQQFFFEVVSCIFDSPPLSPCMCFIL